MNIFEQALIQKLRFESTRGELSAESLYDLPLQSKTGFDLDSVAKTVNTALKATQEESFVSTHSPVQAKLALKLEVVKAVIAHKVAAAQAAAAASNRKAEREVLVNLLADKQTEVLKSLTAEEIQARIAALGT